jgi:NADH-quinone oxidoreductase subunit D
MSDRKNDSTNDVSTHSLSNLDLETPEKPYLDSNELIINMGPQHPATHGVLRVILKLDGEQVLGTECVIGYLHRGVEKIAENRTYTMFNPLRGQHGLCVLRSRTDWVTAKRSRKLLNIEAPPRAKYIRVILTELNRLASHQLWLGTHALDIGAMTPLFYTFRDREEILKIFEKYCGARLTTHAFRIGGCQYETYEGFEQDVIEVPRPSLAPKIDEYEELLTTNRIWLERTKNVGVISKAPIAIALGVTGPVLRASGVKWDRPQSAALRGNYSDFDFEIPIGANGDTYDRYTGAHGGDAAVAAHHPSKRSDGIPEGPIMAQGSQGDEAASRRDLPFDRSAQGRVGILHCE